MAVTRASSVSQLRRRTALFRFVQETVGCDPSCSAGEAESLIRLRVFGTARVETERQPHGEDLLTQPKALGLLVYLAIARPRGLHQRDRLVGLFWPELDQEHARSSLRKLLHRLKQVVGEEVIAAHGNELLGVVRELVWCDVVAFDEAVAEDRLREALDLYTSELLQGFFLPQAGEFDRWLDEERMYYRERAIEAAWELVQRYVASNQLTNAGQLARIVARLAPTNERMLRRVMSMLARLGDRAGAIHLYTRFSEQLWKELELRPSEETARLAEQIRNGAPL